MKKFICLLLTLLLISTSFACEISLEDGTEIDSEAFTYKIVINSEGGSVTVRMEDQENATSEDENLNLEDQSYKFPNLTACTHGTFSSVEDCFDPTIWSTGRDTIEQSVADGLLLVLDLYVRLNAPEGETKEADLTVESIDFPEKNFLQFILISGDRFEETTMENYEVFGHVPLSGEPLCHIGTNEETKITVIIYAEGNNPNCINSSRYYLINNTDTMTVHLRLSEI